MQVYLADMGLGTRPSYPAGSREPDATRDDWERIPGNRAVAQWRNLARFKCTFLVDT